VTISRRRWLTGAAGVTLGLPFLESFAPRAGAQSQAVPPFAFFLRQANGVAAAQRTEVGEEPERFWPRSTGALTTESIAGRTLGELDRHKERLLVVGNVNMRDFNYGDGHARGVLQALTARGPVVEGVAGDSEASGESLDHRIGRELNPGGRDSLFMYASRGGGWLGGACMSYRAAGQRRSPLHNPQNTYEAVAGTAVETPGASALLAARQKSINDLVRGQMQRLLSSPRLSKLDRDRLDLHFQSVRDIEVALSCRASSELESVLDGAGAIYESAEGEDLLATARLHIDIAALAFACGYTRSAALQIGNGNDGQSRFTTPDGQLMENYHFISHRRLSHGSDGNIIPGSDLLHSHVDGHFARLFGYLLDKLAAYQMPDGSALLDHGLAVWFNDNGNGPGHSANNVPYILAGSAGGQLKQGQYLRLPDGQNHRRMLHTIGHAVGVRGSFLDDFGDSSLPGGVLDALLA
jgi:hypothetical protein